MAQQQARGKACEDWRVNILGQVGREAKEQRAPGLQEARVARSPAG